MKYIIIGMGNFGSSLATRLTAMGHEVIGVDRSMDKVEELKDKITHAVALDASDIHAIQTLPWREADIVIVAIGEDFGANVRVTAIFKQLKVKRLISRGINPLHETVLEAIGVDEIVQPESEAADRLAKKLNIKGVIESFSIAEGYNIVEAKVPERYIGKTLEEVDLRSRYNVNIVTILKHEESRNIFGAKSIKERVLGVIAPSRQFESDDVLVLFGAMIDIDRLLQLK